MTDRRPNPDPDDLLAHLPPARLPDGADRRIASAIRDSARTTAPVAAIWQRKISAWQAGVLAITTGAVAAAATLLLAPTPTPPDHPNTPPRPSPPTAQPQSTFIQLALATREPSRHTPDISKWTVMDHPPHREPDQ